MPDISVGQWISINNSIDAYVFSIVSEEELIVGYMQNSSKAIKETVVLNNGNWIFKQSGPNGSYLRAQEAAIVKRGRS